MNHMTIRNNDDLRRAVSMALGFHPSNSVVVVGQMGAPICRIDICDPGTFLHAIAPAAAHWKERPVVLVIFTDNPTDDPSPYATVLDFLEVEVSAAIRLTNPAPDAVDRSTLVEITEKLATTSAEAETMAWSAYRDGHGALAWCYSDRYNALHDGEPSQSMVDLRDRMTNAVPPREQDGPQS